MPQTPVDNTQPSLALTQSLVINGVFPPHDPPGSAGGAFMGEIFTYAFNFSPPGATLGANGQLLSIAQNQAVFSLIGTTYGGNGTTNFALPNLGGVTKISTGQGPGLGPEQLGVPDGASSVTLTLPELPPDLGGTSQPFSNYQSSLPVTYMICVSGVFPSQGGGSASHDLIGEVMPFAGNFAPPDYLPADGQLLKINQSQQTEALFQLIGTTYGGDGTTTFALPDLRGRTIVGASMANPLGALIGSPTVGLTNSQAPNGFANTVQPFDNREPALALNYLISLSGIFPSLNGSNVVDPNTPFLGEVMPFAGNFAPSGWALANGQLLAINQNQALFSLLGTTYGGNGTTNFALPDLRGRTVIGTGNGVTIGSQPGANFPTITAAELPTGPNPLPPAGTTADMILRGANTSPSAGQYEIYNIANNAILTSYSLGQVGTNWQFVGLGGFFGSDTSDMLLRNSAGGFEVYDINNNNITNAAFLGAVGMNWQVMGFGNFSSFGETDMIMRSSTTGGLEVYDISNGQITGANFMGAVGLDWQVGGFGNFSSRGTSDMILRNINTGGLEVYDIDSNQITAAAFMGTVGLEWQIVGVGNFSSMPGETDMIMRNTKTGGFEVYDIANNQITGAAFMGTVGLDWQVAGFGPMHAGGTSDMVLRNVNTGAFLAYDISNNQITAAAGMGQVVLDWQLGGFAADPSTASSASMGDSSQVTQLVQAMAGFGSGGGAADGVNAVALGADASQQPLVTTPQHS
jgi:microcystin-dependent protein/Holliday junction resolvase-like predicted endonuclease